MANGTLNGHADKPNGKKSGVPVERVNKKAFKKYMRDGYTLEDVRGYYNAVHGAYLSVIAQKPDAILAPLRGSEIIVKSMNLLANLDRTSSAMPKVYYPKTGQINAHVSSQRVAKVNPDYEKSLPEPEQKREVRRMVDNILAHAKSRNHPRKRILITLVDEVWSGGALTQVVKMLEEVIAEKSGGRFAIDFNVIAIADERKGRCPEYNYLKVRKVVKEFKVPRLFTTDSPKFLFPLKMEDRAKFFSMRLPFRRRTVERVFSREAAEGRMKLLSDFMAIHGNGHVPGKARNEAQLGRLSRNIMIKRR